MECSQFTKVMLIFGAEKKIIAFSQDHIRSSSTFSEFVRDKAKESFKISTEFVVQYFDKDFEEWANISSDYIASNKEKFQVIQTAIVVASPEEEDPSLETTDDISQVRYSYCI